MLQSQQLHLLKSITIANLKVRYRKTWIGFLWVLINPVILLTVQSFVFIHLLNIPRSNYIYFLISGFLPWILFSQTLEMGTNILKAQSQMLKAFSIPPLILVGALILENLINFIASVILIYLPLCAYFGYSPFIIATWIVSLFPLVLALTALTYLAATWNIFLRDLKYLVSFLLSISYFLTPIFYPISAIPEKFRPIVQYNPIAMLLRPFQDASLGFVLSEWILHLLFASGIALILLVLSRFSWTRQRNDFFLHL